jgi:hypothetical protein
VQKNVTQSPPPPEPWNSISHLLISCNGATELSSCYPGPPPLILKPVRGHIWQTKEDSLTTDLHSCLPAPERPSTDKQGSGPFCGTQGFFCACASPWNRWLSFQSPGNSF